MSELYEAPYFSHIDFSF